MFLLLLTGFVFSKGDTVYTKKSKTDLLETPSVSAKSVAQITWGVKLKIKDVHGRWLLVAGKGKSGWIYSGNVASDKPPRENKKDLLPITADKTTATIAARGLSETSKSYASRKNLEEAQDRC